MADPALNILVVEDEPLLRKLLLTVLKARGHRADACEDGEEALGRLPGKYDLVITDYRMPRMTGLELIRALRGRSERIPVVIMSSNTPEEIGFAPADLLRVEYVRKPYGLTDLDQAIRRAVQPPPA